MSHFGFGRSFAGLRYAEDELPGREERRRLFRRMLRYVRPHAGQTLLVVAMVAGSTLLALVPPLMTKRIIDTAIPERRVDLALMFALVMLLAPVLGGLISVGQNYVSTLVSQRIMHVLRLEMYRHLQRQSLRFFLNRRAGELVSRIQNDVGSIQNVVIQTWVGTVTNVLTLVGTLAVMVSLNPFLALVSFLILPAFAIPVARVGRRRYEIQSRTQAILAEMSGHVAETLSISGALLVTSYGQEPRQAALFERLSRDLEIINVQQALVGRWLFAFVGALSTMGPAVLYGVGSTLVIRHQLTVGALVAFSAYLVQLYGPASNLINVQVNYTGALALFRRVFQVLDEPVEIREADDPHPWSGPGRLDFEDVGFAYLPSRPAIRHVTFSVPAARMTALVGPSGAGKTTLMYLAARFLDPDSGRVLLDGRDLRRVRLEDLRRHMALVTQEAILFHLSLRENIRFGRPEADDAAIWQAIQAAQLEDVVAAMPDGLDTVVGERGYRLSGGEKQRVAIARAFLHNPKVLLLDEATSQLDTLSERRIQEALDRLLEGRTVLAIAHRLSTILRADQILVVDGGRIVDVGTHPELYARGGLYRRLYDEQFRAPVQVVTPS
jgi:ATP-binding cassette subfamily B protein